MANELAKVQSAALAMDKVANEFSLATLDQTQKFTQSLAMAKAMGQLKQLMTDEVVAEMFMPLMDTDLGFRTDGQAGSKTVQVVKNVMIECALRGGFPIGNEVNIISGRAYFTKNFFARKVGEYPELTDLEISLGVPRMLQGGAVVDAKASWKLKGTPMSLERSGASGIPVRVNANMGADAILGKAERKMLASIFKKLTGSSHSEGDASDTQVGELKEVQGADVTAVEEKSATTGNEAVKAAMRAQKAATQAPAAAPAAPAESAAPAAKPPAAATPAAKPPAAATTPPAATPAAKPAAQTPPAAKKTAKATPAAPPAAAAAPTPAPAPTQTPPPAEPPAADPAPASESVVGDLEDVDIKLAGVKKRTTAGTNEARYILVDETNTEYITTNIKAAREAKRALEMKLTVHLKYREVTTNGVKEYVIAEMIFDDPPAADPAGDSAEAPADAPVESNL